MDGTPRPRRGRPGYDQATVLRRAVELFIAQGYDGTSVADLAQDLGLTKSAIYHHVPSKGHLLERALDEATIGLVAAIEAAEADGSETAYARLRQLVRTSVSVLVEHQPAVTLLLRVRGNSDVERAAVARRREIDARLAALVRAAAAEGSLRDDVDPELVSRLLFGMVNSLVEWFRPDGPVDAETVARAVESIAFDGLSRHEP